MENKYYTNWCKHHIIPRSFSKIDVKDEITHQLEKLFNVHDVVLVPYHVHFELHMLLVEMYPRTSKEWLKMSYALSWFSGKRQNKCNISPNEHEQLILKFKEGRKQSYETRQKRSQSLRGKKRSESVKQNIRKARSRPEEKQRLSEQMKKLWQCQNYRQKMLEIQKHTQNRPDVKQNQRKKQREAWNRLGARDKRRQIQTLHKIDLKLLKKIASKILGLTVYIIMLLTVILHRTCLLNLIHQ